MPEHSISHAMLANLAAHCQDEADFFQQEDEQDRAQEFSDWADRFEEASSSGVREITLRIIG